MTFGLTFFSIMFQQLIRVSADKARLVLARSVNYAAAHADRAPKDYYKFLVEKTQAVTITTMFCSFFINQADLLLYSFFNRVNS